MWLGSTVNISFENKEQRGQQINQRQNKRNNGNINNRETQFREGEKEIINQRRVLNSSVI